MIDDYGRGIPESRPVFVDIDGTLTDKSTKGGNMIPARVRQIKEMIRGGLQVVIWSGGGTQYVRWFCKKHNIKSVVMIGKPEFCVDDNPKIRPKLKVLTPEEFFS